MRFSHLTVSDGGVSVSVGREDSAESRYSRVVLEGRMFGQWAMKISFDLLCGDVALTFALLQQIWVIILMSDQRWTRICSSNKEKTNEKQCFTCVSVWFLLSRWTSYTQPQKKKWKTDSWTETDIEYRSEYLQLSSSPEKLSHSSPLRDSGMPIATSFWILSVRNMWTPRPNSAKWSSHKRSFTRSEFWRRLNNICIDCYAINPEDKDL